MGLFCVRSNPRFRPLQPFSPRFPPATTANLPQRHHGQISPTSAAFCELTRPPFRRPSSPRATRYGHVAASAARGARPRLHLSPIEASCARNRPLMGALLGASSAGAWWIGTYQSRRACCLIWHTVLWVSYERSLRPNLALSAPAWTISGRVSADVDRRTRIAPTLDASKEPKWLIFSTS